MGPVTRRSTDSIETELFSKLFQLLDGLKQTPDGTLLHARICNGNRERGAIHGSVNRAFFDFTGTVLGQYAKNSQCDPATRSRAAYILNFVTTYLEAYDGQMPAWRPSHLLKDHQHIALHAAKSFEQHVASMLWAARDHTQASVVAGLPVPTENPVVGDNIGARKAVETKNDLPVQLHQVHSELENLRELLSGKISTAIGRNLDFVAQLRFIRQVLQQPGDNHEPEQLREIVNEGTEELLEENIRLADILHQVEQIMETIHAQEKRMLAEVNRSLQSAATDNFTGIPNRATFILRLEAEIDRALRHGSPLALAFIDPDKLQGRDADSPHIEDEILRLYAHKIMSRFRAYDTVARYSSQEFAVLLPNAGEQQALSALRNAQQRVASARYQHNGKNRAAPTFSSGIAWYLPGEPPAKLLERADNALQHARKSGPNWIEAAIC